MNKLLQALLVVTALFACSAHAAIIRGTSTAALAGSDLTDPENNANPDAYIGYNAVFRSSDNSAFGHEGANNVFDNQLGAAQAKWCCTGGNVWVEADFGTRRYFLTGFTASSANDAAARDSSHWSIKGSNDGVNYTTIFSYDNNSLSAWNSRLQVNQYFAGTDFNAPAAFSIFRYQSTATFNGQHQLGELEFFGTAVPEPGMPALFGLGLAGLALFRRRQARG